MRKREERIGFEIRRLDHMLGTVRLPGLAMERGVPCYLVDAHNRIRLIRLDHPLSVCEPGEGYFPEGHGTAFFNREIHSHEHHPVDGEEGICRAGIRRT